ncbi:MAG: DUF3073 domain-containing protein [Actinomycetes bacterium]
MGRGRAKAKQTKVARELKYSSPQTDLTALQRELSGGSGPFSTTSTAKTADDDLDDEYDPYADEDDDGWASGTR